MNCLKTLLVGAALAATLANSSAQAQSHGQDAKWYVAHWGAEPCVPLLDIMEDGSRGYYGAGPYRTPIDVMNWWTRNGSTIKPYPMSGQAADYIFAFRVIDVPAHVNSVMIYFNDRDVCQRVMAAMEK